MKKTVLKLVVAVALIAGVAYGADAVLDLPKVEMAGRPSGG